jgi:hypothetical protein
VNEAVLNAAAGLARHPIVQICWVVPDIRKAVAQWTGALGAGPFFHARHIQLDDVTYRGQPSRLDQSSALGQWGTIQLELFEQHCGNPSGARDMFAPGESGVHHLTWFAPDLDAELARLNALGIETAMTCRLRAADGMRLAWLDARHVLGTMVEVYEESDLQRRFYRRVARAAEGWNGDLPLRPL